MSKPIVSQEELNKIVSKGWAEAEKLKAQKDQAKQQRPTSAVKKAHIKSQNTIMEENALTQIVSKAWTNVELKKQKDLKTKIVEDKAVRRPASKKAHLKSQNTIMEENALKEIIPKAWAVAESKLNKKHQPHTGGPLTERTSVSKLQHPTIIEEKPAPAKKPLLKSQNTIMEEAQLEKIVGQAWMTVEPKLKQKHQASPAKPKRHVHIKSQNTLMEEAQLEKIVGKAWVNAEKIKEKTIKERQKSKTQVPKQKPHRQESILEELVAQKCVNDAWGNVQNKIKNSPCKSGRGGLLKIDEESQSHIGMSDESSFDASDSSPSP